MTTLIVTVFMTSLLGSLHCAGMCGAFVAFCVGTEKQNPTRHAAVQGAYHGGRLISYALLGLLAGALGSAVDVGGRAFGLQRPAMMIAGAAMIVFGFIVLLRVAGVRIRRLGVPRPLQSLFLRSQAFAQHRHPVLRALLIGVFSLLLPCGWLWAFVVVAAGTGSPSAGALTMAVFWLGTVPVLAAIGVGVQAMFGPLRRHLPAAMAGLLVLMGLVVVVRGYEMPAVAESVSNAAPTETSIDSTIDHVRSIDQAGLPCCAEHE